MSTARGARGIRQVREERGVGRGGEGENARERARATGKKGAGKKAKANPAADFVDSSVEDYETIDGEASVENVDEGFGAPEREKTSAPVKRLSVPSTERPTTSEATAEEKTLTVEFDCEGYSADVIGKKGENQQVLQWKSGADVRAHPSKDSFIEIRGTG